MSTETSAANQITPPIDAEDAVTADVAQVSAPVADTPPADEATSDAPGSIADLRPKMELRGKVRRIELFGAFVDIGVGTDGLIHISQLREEPVKNVNDVLAEGDEVTVWVRKVDPANQRLDLTMIKPPGMLWSEIQNGQVLTGTVVRVEKFGAFVDVGAERPGMVHVSELSSGYVGSPQEVVKVGDEVRVKVLKVNSRKKQIDLSMKALEMPAEPAVDPRADDDDKVPTAMELALRRALQATDADAFPELQSALEGVGTGQSAARRKQSKREKRAAAEKRRQQQEEIISRTLSSRDPSRNRNANPAN